MNKNFEEEYQNMIESELPDLWDRIEAQLPDTAAARMVPETGIETEKETEKEKEKEKVTVTGAETETANKKRHPGKKISYRHMTAWIMAVAAVVCVCLLLPVLSLTRQDNAASLAETEKDMEAACEAGASEESYMEAPMPEDSMSTGGAMADEAVAGNSVQSTVTAEEAEEEFMTEDTVAEEMPVEADPEEAASGEADSGEAVSEEAAPEEDPPRNTAVVLMAVEILDRITDNRGDTLYLAEILENPEEEADTGRYLYLRYAEEGELEDYDIDVTSYESTLPELIPSEKYEIYLYETEEDIREYGIKTADKEQYKRNVYVIVEIPLYD